ncbi:MAG TPA: hypothetical protein VME46_22615 [Acidimicrobiales bacterium]|nr:hypothetical protein [Acidimicrobiales bacterium]
MRSFSKARVAAVTGRRPRWRPGGAGNVRGRKYKVSSPSRVAGVAAIVASGVICAAGPLNSTAQAGAQGLCTDSWVGPGTGTSQWYDGANWSTGKIPAGTSLACINKAGTYVVVLPGYASVQSLRLGATAGNPTLEVLGAGSNAFFGSASVSTVGGDGTRGTLELHPGASYYAALGGKGAFSIAPGGTLTTSGAAGAKPAYVQAHLTNQAGGTARLDAPSNIFEYGIAAVNSGSFQLPRSAALVVESGSSFTQAGGTLALGGTLTLIGGKFVQAGGSESGGPALLEGADLVDGPGALGFDLTGVSILSGDIPSGQTVTLTTHFSDSTVFLSGSTSVKGTLAMEPSASHYVALSGKGSLTVASGGTLATSGPAGAQPVHIRVPLTNQAGGSVEIASPSDFEYGPATVNSGNLRVAEGGELVLSSGSTLRNAPTGTIGVTVDATKGAVSGISGAGVSLNGTLAVTTLGSPAAGSSYVVIGGPVSGEFSASSFGHQSYSVRYTAGSVSSNEVVLTAR